MAVTEGAATNSMTAQALEEMINQMAKHGVNCSTEATGYWHDRLGDAEHASSGQHAR